MRELYRAWHNGMQEMSEPFGLDNLERGKIRCFNFMEDIEDVRLDECIIMQSTGQTDNDKNVIFDGDIIQKSTQDGKPISPKGIVHIHWRDAQNGCGYNLGEGGSRTIIGNIYQNKEIAYYD